MKQFKDMWDFSEGLAAVAYDKHNYGYINKEGKVIVPFEYVYKYREKDKDNQKAMYLHLNLCKSFLL